MRLQTHYCREGQHKICGGTVFNTKKSRDNERRNMAYQYVTYPCVCPCHESRD